VALALLEGSADTQAERDTEEEDEEGDRLSELRLSVAEVEVDADATADDENAGDWDFRDCIRHGTVPCPWPDKPSIRPIAAKLSVAQ
jgi:hypothetical protein